MLDLVAMSAGFCGPAVELAGRGLQYSRGKDRKQERKARIGSGWARGC